jgi:hypothetical protein
MTQSHPGSLGGHLNIVSSVPGSIVTLPTYNNTNSELGRVPLTDWKHTAKKAQCRTV